MPAKQIRHTLIYLNPSSSSGFFLLLFFLAFAVSFLALSIIGDAEKIYGVENPVGSTIDSRPHCLSTVFFNVTDVDLVLDILQLDNCKHSAGFATRDVE
jgi:hypothetical protein